jgi:putative ABC transport system permease protein
MTWLRLSLKEWQRRPLRTSLTAAGVAIAIAALYSLMAIHRGYRDGVQQELGRLGAHVLLVPKGCPYDAASMALHGASWPCFLKESYLAEVRSVPGVAVAAPVFMTAVDDDKGNRAVYLGIDTNTMALKSGWHIAGEFPVRPGSMLAGSEAAQRYAWSLGGDVSLPGLRGQTGKVLGTLAATRSAEDSFIYVPLSDVPRRFHHTNELTHILVRLADPNDLDRAVAQLRGCDAGLAMNVVPLAHVFRTIQSLVNTTRVLLGCIAAVALLVAATGVTNTVLMAVAERAREIGVLRALGASRGNVFHLIWLETLQVCLAGAVAGVLGAWLASGLVERWVRAQLPFAPAQPLIHYEWWVAAGCLVTALALGSLASFLPAWRAATLPPIITLRDASART